MTSPRIWLGVISIVIFVTCVGRLNWNGTEKDDDWRGENSTKQLFTLPVSPQITTSTPPISSSTIYPVGFDIIGKDFYGNTELHRLAVKGDEEAIRELIHLNADVNAKNFDKATPLHGAAEEAQRTCGNKTVTACLSVIDLLVKSGADVTAQDWYGDTFLHKLFEANTFLTSEQLHQVAIDYGHLFNARTKLYLYGASVLQMTLARVKFEISTLSVLYERGVDFKEIDKRQHTVLVYAVWGQQSVPVLSKLIEFGADYTLIDWEWESLLQKAAGVARRTCGNKTVKSCLSVIDFLVKMGAHVDRGDGNEETFLQTLLGNGTTFTPAQLHQIAIDYGKLFNLRNPAGWTPLTLALSRVKFEVSTLTLLQEKGVDFKAIDKDQRTVLYFAIWGHQSVPVLSKLIDLGADYKRLKIHRESLLHIAAWHGNAEALAFFIREEGSDINGRTTPSGFTPLHYVGGLQTPNSKPLEVTRLLLHNGADKTMVTDSGRTPYDWIKTRDFPEKERVLQLLDF